jgi:two-component system chemotaxis response regulator CheY
MTGYRFDRLRVLVVDDSAHVRQLVSTMLRGLGIKHIYEAADAERAWVLLREINPDVVLLDWILEGASGLELTRRVRTDPGSTNPLVPIIMITGNTHIERVREARDAGINEFLAKPLTVKGLMTRLSSVIEHPRPFVRTQKYFGPCRRRRNRDEYQGPERRADDESPARAIA